MPTPLSRRRLFGAAAVGAVTAAGFGGRSASARRRLPPPTSVTETDPALLSAIEAATLLQSRALHPRDLLDACLARSAEHDGSVEAWIRIYSEQAYAAADLAAQRLATGSAPLVCGLPIGMKDVFAVAGLPLTASSGALAGNIAAGDSGVWRRLRDAGMVLMGHLHTHEFAIGTATPQVGNPWGTEYSPGGSSGGSAAALAARFTPCAVGTDTGGSLRIPASACGITAIKPTFGRCSTSGVIPLTWTRDHTGPMGRSVADASLLLSYMAGVDVDDPSTSVGPDVPANGYPLSAVGGPQPLSGIRFGLPSTATEELPESVGVLFSAFLDLIRRLGGVIVDVRMPTVPTGLLTGDLAEFGLYHQQFVDRLPSYRPESAVAAAAAVASLGVPVADYFSLERERRRYQHEYNRMFAEHALDVVLRPGALTDGIRRDTLADTSVFAGARENYFWANYTGAPVICVPAGRSTATGIPFGVQLGSLPWAEESLISTALELQEADPVWRDTPPLVSSPRRIPDVRASRPGPGPSPTNTDDSGPGFRFVPTTSTAAV
ncbi:amidase [Rhodococcus oxybenzonivorans]|uniref:amidase n=1 Tax=Rhodococcus TaxID=1827 RepID=UPI00135895FC|nr:MULTISPECIES: amidase [Rhodococcus]MDV7355451.1 amidase [Rhodococcus oxybenzonivorans]